MASRAAKQWRSMLNSMGQNRSFSSSASTPRKYATTTASATMHAEEHHLAKSKFPMADWAPIMILGGFLGVVLTIGTHSAWQQLAYCPTVQLRKKNRETIPEVYSPDAVLVSSDKFVNKSFFRKVAHMHSGQPT